MFTTLHTHFPEKSRDPIIQAPCLVYSTRVPASKNHASFPVSLTAALCPFNYKPHSRIIIYLVTSPLRLNGFFALTFIVDRALAKGPTLAGVARLTKTGSHRHLSTSNYQHFRLLVTFGHHSYYQSSSQTCLLNLIALSQYRYPVLLAVSHFSVPPPVILSHWTILGPSLRNRELVVCQTRYQRRKKT